MLDTIKRYSNTWVAKIFMAVLILSFGLSGIAYVFTNIGTSSLAKVGSETISNVDFDRAYRQQLNQFARQYGRALTPQEAQAFGIPTAVISELTGLATIDNLIKDFGIGASDEMVAKAVADDPNFQGTLAGFDRQRFNQVLAQLGYTPTEYTELQANNVKRSQLIRGMFEGVPAPKTILELSYHFQNDTRTLDYFELGETALETIAQPTDAQLQQYLAANQSEYRTQETRNIDILVLTPESLGATLEVTDAEISAEYEKTGASFVRPATRAVKYVELTDAAQVQMFNTPALTGTALEQKLAEIGLAANIVDLGRVAEDEIENQTIAQTAFNLDAEGQAIAIIEGKSTLVMADNFDEGGQPPLAQIRDEVAKLAATRKAKDIILDRIDEIEELRATLKPIKEIATQFGLETQNIDVTSSGIALALLNDLPEGSVARLLPQVTSAEMDKLLPAVSLGANEMAWFDLNKITEARDQTLDEVRQLLASNWTQAETDKALDEKAQSLKAMLDEGKQMMDVANTVGQFPLASQATTRRGDGAAITANVASAAFEGGEGHTGAVKTTQGNYVIFKVTSITAADLPDEQNDELSDSLGDSIANNMYQQFITAKREKLGYSVNQQALTQVLAIQNQ